MSACQDAKICGKFLRSVLSHQDHDNRGIQPCLPLPSLSDCRTEATVWSLRTYISISEEPWIHLHTFSKVRPGRNWWLSATHSAHFVGAKKIHHVARLSGRRSRRDCRIVSYTDYSYLVEYLPMSTIDVTSLYTMVVVAARNGATRLVTRNVDAQRVVAARGAMVATGRIWWPA